MGLAAAVTAAAPAMMLAHLGAYAFLNARGDGDAGFLGMLPVQ